ncbi:MAG: HD domain-containing protein [Candidatus Omnitrophica bacterium]|nr:HD domain-containing protein [Candidatus Omnitrophota bacterium]
MKSNKGADVKTYVQDLKVGEVIETFFLLKKKELDKTKDNKPYLKLGFADKSGSIEGRMWNQAETADTQIDIGGVVMVRGTVTEYKGSSQIKVEEVRAASPEEYQQSDLIRCIENRDTLFEKVKSILRKNVSNQWISQLVMEFLKDEDLMNRFKKAPGARSWHNAYIGGLLEHTYEVMVVVEKVCELYPEANKDMALIGAFLHDVGKVFELDPQTFEYTHKGGLVGHLSLGFELLIEKIKNIDHFPEDIQLHLKHIILSHHGEYEQQSPVLPKTLEAIMVYHADELVSQTNAIKEIVQAQSYNERAWSNFVSIKNRKFFLKRIETTD